MARIIGFTVAAIASLAILLVTGINYAVATESYSSIFEEDGSGSIAGITYCVPFQPCSE